MSELVVLSSATTHKLGRANTDWADAVLEHQFKSDSGAAPDAQVFTPASTGIDKHGAAVAELRLVRGDKDA